MIEPALLRNAVDRAPVVAAAILEHPLGITEGVFTALHDQPVDMTWPEFQRGCLIAAEIVRANIIDQGGRDPA